MSQMKTVEYQECTSCRNLINFAMLLNSSEKITIKFSNNLYVE